ncbi:cardiolipin synthase (CMP-forming) [Malassezia vespertilionis]|uniref:Crd1p n=1 Tax=Malassezia vespertilionis TaxID=2020962 RepID=A0A2N1JCK6_9BASI|nr:cardiolipin synthase (CMP-forming) [Malassezia vespertilionis]PKI84301.1 hypothetical protein MVES_001453 [Malassezia vespertilionis]WFD06200.1 cardiolipin synthase (CMP-forming) [Malassezia vespertilionis]
MFAVLAGGCALRTQGMRAGVRVRVPLLARALSRTAIWRQDAPRPPNVRPTRKEVLATVPNMLTVSRICMCPFIGWSVVCGEPYLTLGLLGVAGATDLLDGYIARRYKSYTTFGSIADPAADKLLMATMVVSLCASGQMALPLAAIILGRDIFLVALAFYMRFRSLPPPRTWTRYCDPHLPSVHVTPTQLSKANTFLQLLLVGLLTLYPVLPDEWQNNVYMQRTRQALSWVVAGTTLWTGVDYACSRRAVRYLHRT